jgi:hypothetical protein
LLINIDHRFQEMPVHKSAAAIYRQRLRNLAKARAAKRRMGGRKTHHRRRVVHRRTVKPLYLYGGHAQRARVHRRVHHRRMGGFIPAALAAHGILQQIKPVTNGEKLVQALGWDKAINRGLDRLGPVGAQLEVLDR